MPVVDYYITETIGCFLIFLCPSREEQRSCFPTNFFFGALSGSGGGSLWERGGVFLGGENDGMIQNGRHGVV